MESEEKYVQCPETFILKVSEYRLLAIYQPTSTQKACSHGACFPQVSKSSSGVTGNCLVPSTGHQDLLICGYSPGKSASLNQP